MDFYNQANSWSNLRYGSTVEIGIVVVLASVCPLGRYNHVGWSDRPLEGRTSTLRPTHSVSTIVIGMHVQGAA
jgi:hypothetical protein